MCTNGKFVYNKYTGDRYFVKCGKCHSCMVEKSNKYFSRIMSHECKPYFRLFVTLNYNNESIPYIRLSDFDLSGDSPVEVWRDIVVYHLKNKHCQKTIRKINPHVIGTYVYNEFDKKMGYNTDFSGVMQPVKFQHSDCLPICYGKDFSCFLKRFRITMQRHYGINLKDYDFNYVKVSEYGPTTKRPHFHTILYFSPELRSMYPQIKRALISSWPFCSISQLNKNISIACSCQSYVSKYAVRPSDYCNFHKARAIAQKVTYGRNFGFNRSSFSPSSILQQVERGNFLYTCQSVDKDGKPVSLSLRVPSYVYNRYFPRFKGQYLCSNGEIFSFLQSRNNLALRSALLSDEESSSFFRKVDRASSLLHLSAYQYAFFYMLFRDRYASFSLRSSYLDYVSPNEFYYDFSSCFTPFGRLKVNNGVPIVNFDISMVNYDPNTFSVNKLNEHRASVIYDDCVKKRKFNNYVESLDVSQYLISNVK